MSTREGVFVLDDCPNFLIRQRTGEGNHCRPGDPVLDHPENLPFCPMSPEPMMMEITGRRIESRCGWTIAPPVCAMAVEASSFALVERLTLFNDLR